MHSKFHFISIIVLVILFFPFLTTSVKAAHGEHPFLAVRESMYSELGSRASQEPWQSMKQQAATQGQEPLPAIDHWDYWFLSSNVIEAATLAYVLEPSNNTVYKDKILESLNTSYTLRDKIGGCGFGKQVPPGTWLVNSIIAFDVVYNDLTEIERATAQQQLDDMVNRVDCGWEWNLFSVRAIWALFNGDMETFQTNKYYYDQMMEMSISPDGVFSGGPNYAEKRFAWRRDSKYILIDIAEFTGNGNYYSDPLYINFYEWLYGYSYTPMNSFYTFGDTAPNSQIMNWGIIYGHAPVRAYRFSPKAAGYAALRWGDKVPYPNLLSYVLMEEPFPAEPIKPTSRIFKDGGAYFVEDDYQFTSLSGVLNNNTKRVWHTHSDVNALHLTAYGENVLQNSGYNGAGNGFGTFSWFYISHEASSNNTVLIDMVNHLIGPILGNGGDFYSSACDIPGYVNPYGHCNSPDNIPYTKRGAGISEGFTSNKLDYASGDSGQVVVNGHHNRNFIFVHPQDGLNGYFVTFDEVAADDPSSSVNVIFHPNSDHQQGGGPETLQLNEEYQWDINGGTRFNKDNVVKLAIGLGQIPINVEFPWSLLTAGGSAQWKTIGYHFKGNFKTDSGGKANIPTVLYPSDPTHAKANIQRIATSDYDGLSVDAGSGLVDYIVAVPFDKPTAVNLQNTDIDARSTIFRKGNGSINFYFVRNGTKFIDTATQIGFESSEPVSLHLKDTSGSIISPATELTIYDYDITSVSLDGKPISLNETNPNFVKVTVPRGTFEISYTNEGQPPPTPTPLPGDVNADGVVNILDYTLLSNAFGTSDPAADINSDGTVNILDYTILSNNFGSTSP